MKRSCCYHPFFFLISCLLLFYSATSLPVETSETQPTSSLSHPTTTTTTITHTHPVPTTDSTSSSSNDDDNIEDEIVRETISSSRGHRDEPGKRDQWDSTEHVGSKSSYDIQWRPPSPRAERLLKLYRLDCRGCSDDEAVDMINEYVVQTKRELKEKERREWWIWWGRRFVCLVVLVLGLGVSWCFLLEERDDDGGGDNDGRERMIRATTTQTVSEPVVVRKPDYPSPPTWIDNEQKEIWTPKQEKQFQKALREFGAVGKKERYVLIAAQVTGKSRIECLTHHRMQQLTEQWEREKKKKMREEEEQHHLEGNDRMEQRERCDDGDAVGEFKKEQ